MFRLKTRPRMAGGGPGITAPTYLGTASAPGSDRRRLRYEPSSLSYVDRVDHHSGKRHV